MARPFLSVIIPAYNEANRLPITLIDVDRHLADQNFSYEIIVALSPSEDDTGSILARFAHLIKKLKVVALTENLGKGYAIKRGMKEAKGTWRLCMDADNSVAVVEFLKMIPYLGGEKLEVGNERYEVLIGSRYIPGSYLQPAPPVWRQILSQLGNFLLRSTVLRGIHDAQCGFKCFSENSASKIFHRSKINGWAIDLELLAIAKQLGYKIKEIPIFYSHDDRSHVHSFNFIEMKFDILKIIWRTLMGTYTKLK